MSSETIETIGRGILYFIMSTGLFYPVYFSYEKISSSKEENRNLKTELVSIKTAQTSGNLLESVNRFVSDTSNKIQSGNISCSDIDSLKSEISSLKNEILVEIESKELDFALIQEFGEKIKYLNKLLSRFYIEKCS